MAFCLESLSKAGFRRNSEKLRLPSKVYRKTLQTLQSANTVCARLWKTMEGQWHHYGCPGLHLLLKRQDLLETRWAFHLRLPILAMRVKGGMLLFNSVTATESTRSGGLSIRFSQALSWLFFKVVVKIVKKNNVRAQHPFPKGCSVRLVGFVDPNWPWQRTSAMLMVTLSDLSHWAILEMVWKSIYMKWRCALQILSDGNLPSILLYACVCQANVSQACMPCKQAEHV